MKETILFSPEDKTKHQEEDIKLYSALGFFKSHSIKVTFPD